jgi:regulator of cell morphogenesis and NO signaling
MTSDIKIKMADMMYIEPDLVHLIRRMNIPLGFGEKSVERVCLEAGLNPWLFIALAEAFRNDEEIPESLFDKVSITDLVDYIKENHKYYLEEMIPSLNGLIDKLIKECKENNEKLVLIKGFLEQYRKDLEVHIAEEEDNVIPYILEVENSFITKKLSGELENRIRHQPIQHFLESHSDIEEKIFELKNIIIKYLPLVPDQETAYLILPELFRLEKDIRIHSRIEDCVIVPRIDKVEKELLKLV